MSNAALFSMIGVIARALQGRRHVAVGANSPIPATAALIAQQHNPKLRISILGSQDDNPFTDGGRELFDCAAQGRIDTFFFSGVQIDGCGNVNLLGIGEPPRMKKRFVGNFGAPYLAGLVPNIILFRTDHTSRSLVENVDFISAVGKNVTLLVTNRAVFRKIDGRLAIASLHPGETLEEVRAATGFAFQGQPSVTPELGAADRLLIDTKIRPHMETLYPAFATSLAS